MASSKIRGRETPRFLTPRASSLRQRRRLGEIRTSELARVTDLSTAFISLVERGHRRLSDKRYDQLRRGLEFIERERLGPASSGLVSLAALPLDETAREGDAQDTGTTEKPAAPASPPNGFPSAHRPDALPPT
jgi:hypothetical protein